MAQRCSEYDEQMFHVLQSHSIRGGMAARGRMAAPPAAPVLRLVPVLLAGLLLVTSCGTGFGPARPSGLKGTVRIALVNVFSGPSGYLGEYAQNSLQVEVDAINAGGGLLGSRLEVVSADDEQKADKGTELVREQLAEGDVKLLVGPSTAEVVMAAAPTVSAAHTPSCVLDVPAAELSRLPFTFAVQERDADRISALLGYVLRGRTDVKRIGLFDAGGPSPSIYDRDLHDQSSRFGLQYVGSVIASGAGDARPLVQQMLQKGAQAALLPADPAAAARIAQAAGQLGATKQLQLLGTSSLSSYSFAQDGGDGVNGLVFEDTIESYISDVPQSRWPPPYAAFVHRITSQYGYASNGVEMKGLPGAADCILEWSHAVKAAGSFDGERVARAWERLDLPPSQTVLGAREKLAPGDHDALGPEGIFVYQWSRTGDRWSLKQLAGPGA
jgi:branched-chain amino acid transport system substrate-binding protein